MKSITKIRVGKNTIGIIGLKAALTDTAAQFGEAPNDKAGSVLLERLSKQNYIAAPAAALYERAFLREYHRHIGAPLEEPPSEQGIQIKVLGPGCPQCERLEREMISALGETGIDAELEHVRDMQEIASFGVMGTPALIINDEVKCVGTVPPRSKLTAWLKLASENKHGCK